MKTRADIIDKLQDKYKISADSLTERELLIIGIATEDHDSEIEKLFLSAASNDTNKVCPDCGDYGWAYNEDCTRRFTCPCHY